VKLANAKNVWNITGAPVEQLEHVPGLTLTASGASGSIDAMAVVAHRMGIAIPGVDSKPGQFSLPKDLRPYQVEGIERLAQVFKRTGGAVLGDDMGLGKTRQAIELARVLCGTGRVLVVCPASVRETWRDELKKWLDVDAAVMGPPSDTRYQEDWERATQASWVVCGMEKTLEDGYTLAFESGQPSMLIIDEAHNFRGREAKRSRVLGNIAAECTYKLALTGTPVWSRPKDLYQLLHILFGKRFGSSFQFDMAYCGGQLNEWGGMENKGATRLDELQLRLGYYMVRREKREVLKDLPPLTRQVMWLDPTPKATRAMQVATMTPSPKAMQAALEATLDGKMDEAVRLAVDAKRFLLLTWRKDHAAKLAQRIADTGVRCYLLTGDVPQPERMAAVRQAAAEGAGIVATIDSVKEGINMQAVASIGIMHALDWVPLKMAQAEARIHRMGQTVGVTWYYLAMRESMDAPVVRTVLSKLDSMHALIGGDKGMRGDLGANEDGAGSSSKALADIYSSLESGEDSYAEED
jgi:SWI/SNF-related matrix-associated actin-dependent regulator 1 of chromatin subfamily A